MREPAPIPARRSVPLRQWLMAVAGLMMIAAAAAMVLRQRAPSPPPPVVPAAGRRSVALYVQHEGAALRLHWDPAADAVRAASAGVLFIADGARESRLDLNPQDLRSGAASYWPESREVAFRLELEGGASGTIRASAGPPVPDRPSSFDAGPKPPIRRAAKPVPLQSEDAGEDDPPPPTIVRYGQDPALTPDETKEPPPPPARAMAPQRKPLSAANRDPEEPPRPKSVSHSRWRRLAHKIPLLRRLRKHQP